ncbi:cell division protein FtsQ/DivIB [Oryzobacter terrae]|uniref:cell division protein FtsQ/DivIB n=1 Tax=Oryzobacter terrae TaxID=1620385 RepID=UPI0036713A45
MSLGTTRRPPDRAPSGASSSANRFRERALSHRRRPLRLVLTWLLAVAVVAGLAWVVGWSTLLGVRDVEVVGVTGEEATAVAELVEVPTGTPLARVDTDAVADRVRERITVAEVSVRRAWPGTLSVEVVPRTAALVVKNPQGRLEVVDAEGVAFREVAKAPAGVPLVTATGSKGTTREALQSSLALLDALPHDLADDVRAVTVSSADLVTFTLGTRTVVWGSGEESPRKVAILRALLTTKAKVIDVSAPDTPVTR